ncbi:predicted protein [Nematostella vectensis]|uniref:Glycosyltransferase STELLO1 n=1 Tax=Nematostella vectensis TaxID=45351 RepID=A7RJ60_NEMVE|nr:probable glycosyltransferase STELLO1 [Nematostella vectensis]EDO48521.1 predicted protein [Nematostella vectensis]|eukprot:XP_001640584.1 predicted protein [Nematostella vectensis]
MEKNNPPLLFILKRCLFLARKEVTKPCMLALAILQIIVCVSLYELYNHHLIFVNIDPDDYAQDHGMVHVSKKLHIDWAHLDMLKSQGTLIDWEKIELLPKSLDERHDRWVVLTTVHEPTIAAKRLAGLEGWRTVVIGDEKTPPDWSHSNVIYLDLDKQKSLGYEISNHIPKNHYSRKNIGYLYAIQHGANIIYDADTNTQLLRNKLGFHLDEDPRKLLVYSTNHNIINPYPHFGQSTVWPRGYPLEMIGAPPQHTFVLCEGINPGIQQALSNGASDVDSIFKLTRNNHNTALNITFNGKSEKVAIPHGAFSVFNAQNTLYHHDVLWGLLLPVSVQSRVTDVWRSYWAQRLIWQVGRSLVFHPPNSHRSQLPHDNLRTLREEQMLYYNTGEYLESLLEWSSTKSAVFDQVLDLGIFLTRKKLWSVRDAHLLEAWLHDLIRVGYIPPSPQPKVHCSSSKDIYIPP